MPQGKGPSKDDYDRRLIEEINRSYEGKDHSLGEEGERRARFRRIVLGATALVLALVFLFSVTGRWLAVFAGPSYHFLRESWALAGDPMVSGLRTAVVRVYVENRPGVPDRSLRGSGFNICPGGLVVTNRHLVDEASAVRVSFPGRGTFSAESWAVSPHVDLAVIELKGEDLPVVEFSRRPPLPGDELLVIGNPLQFARVANRGRLAGLVDNPGRPVPLLLIEALVYPGSSGSPVFNEAGEVVGVVYATAGPARPEEVRGLAVDSREVLSFLEESGCLP